MYNQGGGGDPFSWFNQKAWQNRMFAHCDWSSFKDSIESVCVIQCNRVISRCLGIATPRVDPHRNHYQKREHLKKSAQNPNELQSQTVINYLFTCRHHLYRVFFEALAKKLYGIVVIGSRSSFMSWKKYSSPNLHSGIIGLLWQQRLMTSGLRIWSDDSEDERKIKTRAMIWANLF